MGKSISLGGLWARASGWGTLRFARSGTALLLALYVLASPASAAPVKGDVAVTVNAAGFLRLVFTLAEENEADVRLDNGIIGGRRLVAATEPGRWREHRPRGGRRCGSRRRGGRRLLGGNGFACWRGGLGRRFFLEETEH